MKRVRRREESGVTLVELLITMVIMSMIIGGIAASFVTALDSSRPTSERVRESNDAQLIASFLVHDAQSAGGTNPLTGGAYSSVGVSTTDAASCAPDPSLVFRFSWYDHVTAATSHLHVANYYYDGANHQIVRRTCVDGGSASTLTLGNHIASVSGSCNPACSLGPLPDTVSLTVTATNDPSNAPSPYTYTLTASVRPQGQTAPCTVGSVGCTTTTGDAVPLIALGGGTCVDGTAGVEVGGSVQVNVYGGVTVDGSSNSCPSFYYHLSGTGAYASGDVDLLSPGSCSGCPFSTTTYTTSIGDPFAALAPPPDTCAAGGSNPATTTSGGVTHYHPGTYPSPVTISTDAVFDAGIYVFCAGSTSIAACSDNPGVAVALCISGGNVTTGAGGALFYFKGGTLAREAGTQTLAPPDSGDYAGLSIWQAAADTASPLYFAGNGSLTIAGTIYAPSVEVRFRGTAVTSVQAIVAGTVSFEGNHSVSVGTPPPQLSMTGPATLPDWTVNTPYPTTQVTVTGGSGVNNFSAPGLPTGLTINAATGVISGTPTAVGTFTFSVGDKDSAGDIASLTYTVTISAPPSITGPPSLTDWTINRDYPGTAIIASAGTTPYKWSATGLPTGLTINTNTGVVSGTPSATGTYNATITLTDNAGVTATRNYTIVINSPPSITGPSSLPNWTVSQVYPNQTMTATNGTQPYSWAASGLPTGLAINSGTGVISGTPNSAGTFSVSVTMTDKAGASATKNYSVTINPALGIATAALPNAEQGQPYNFTLTPTSGGTPPFTWSITSGPAWLSIGPASGTLTGTPPAAGAPNVTVKVTDSTGASASKTYVLTIASPVSISGPASLRAWTINRDYPGTAIIVTGGVSPFTWSQTGLPAGMTINTSTGVISGTPSVTGTFPVTVTVVDSYNASSSINYSLVINPAPVITTAALPDGEQSVSYSTTVSASLGTPAYTWAASGLPAGLSMNAASGVLSGTPTVSGTFSITITATDVAGAAASRILNLNLNTAPTASGALPNWTVGRPYPSTQLTGSGGTPPYTFSSTPLPAGLTLDANTGIVSGTPTATGTTAVTVTIRDAVGGSSTQAYSITINPVPSITSTSPLPNGELTLPYSATLTRTGGTPNLTWSSTPLPAGLTLDANTGAITGTPTAAGTTSVTFTLTDATGATTSKALSITINPRPSITSVQLKNNGTAGKVEAGDQIIVTFSAQMKVSSLCSTWSGDTTNQTLSGSGVVVNLNNGAGAANDTITVSNSTCAFNFGTIDLGSAAYATGNATFSGNGGNASTIAWNATTHALTITLGKLGGGPVATVASSTPIYTAAAAIVDTPGATLSNSPFTLPTGQQF